MKLENLKSKEGSRHKTKRVGRGFGSGIGKTSTRGSKGQKSRKSGHTRPGFEGGQTTLYRRIPKIGFNNKNFANNYNVVTLNNIVKLNLANVDKKVLVEKGLIEDNKLPIKVIGTATISKPISVSAHKFSKGSVATLEKSKSKFVVIK
ncbi:50S ribosomal protein L15 [Malacoplasma penetrans]|uniref:Large ribosomal subunit protein uL15 n=1 Tax=Malacoplasma penetrans (strain HF-2) TaxID=272633 RepID=RL15_MALP2|nr:50S ribosomal protein L15 [Malacoplasma penetrans]Q8EUD1.1 RecName: Full=Large ribosomal subunit protein uL15; AltName: Full=50S ribosomal protein L15 [Malacoplasma penetrans HF-2]RXY96838.1 50S ribosomal protein L15 [Malacoplasma penetrans]BAC44785.1 ribosomal protein L15 [Malacoplasma penetrans HF-2]